MDYMTEKKLRPLYEAIDEGQTKLALQHTTKLLKKNPDWPLVKALKAVVLVRTGKDDEAAALCQQVKKSIPTDNATLQACTMAYNELGQHHAIVELYENAANQQPKNEEFGNHWFMAMVRNNDYKGQQAAALKLHRTFKQNKYLFWAIMSLALQGKNSALSYTLAERMMAKAQEEGRLDEVEHMRLYLLIMLDQNKHEQALTLLEGPLGQKSLRDPEVRQIKTELLLTNKKWQDVLKSTEQALRNENSDDWISWRAYFDALDALVTENSDDALIKQARALVAQLSKQALEAPVLKRGPFLAELELDYRLDMLQKGDEKAILDNILSYFSRFGSKSCCYEDLQAYISFLKQDTSKAKSFIDSLKATINEAKEKPAIIKNVYKNVNVRKIERYLGLQSNLSLEQGLSLANELCQAYQDALPLGEGLEKTENQYGDDYVLLASHVLVDLYHEHKSPALLIQAVSFLEDALEKSIYNFHIKLTLVRLYAMLGVCNRPVQIFRTMDIKQVQFDTMIHYFTDRFISLACLDEVEQLLLESLMIYKSNQVETPEMVVKAYQYGTFSKIQEFIEFRSRLDSSLQQAITNVELTRIESSASSFQVKYAVQYFQDLDVSKIKCDDAFVQEQSDNRDFKVFLNCNSEEQPKGEELFKLTKSTNRVWLQTFSYILNILSAACSTKENKDLGGIVKQFNEFLQRKEVPSEVTPQEFAVAKYIREISSALVSIKDPATRKNNAQQAAEHLKNAGAILEKELSPEGSFVDEVVSWNLFHKVSIALEAFNYGAVLVEMINRALGLTSKDAKKKAAENANNDIFIAALQKMNEANKTLLLRSQAAARRGNEFFKGQFQKTLTKSITESVYTLDQFKEKANQNRLTDRIKKMTSSWTSSVSHLSEETTRRVMKL
ncbi:N-acetyltransferase B complex non catalytic subunit-domain-containing protein [Zychaea mexicana]|uniref:N-acetyltransferase B complex non catalytic subunit-domain-containing protein n=1 Tax=Zychaea mexicana TaxID=64656 RepID=UPI0022FF2707|nr:N-acetyltransferase B complex non catalytic subunit-domain-containing protein [Zychaea mexicana]KAI9492083.1 N-acetyltransferase B complex non catalytic subunit-domain-containing protein [Zychaea mexicana]